ncbi:retrovirus-related Pol polyprotein from type-2 retrotransposable element R2DM [Nephila pilipes]|uniref:Retrovirus-related Pol polyprotein from type-2 retrotransposable element R2DM n=1 Tax=Nephila pilipes TaxID=299642 RepID=A0A8X6MSL0_NEPPI|nr:retrovirus-related Pol polyprotein from type-2 retrotransposable element R2DM [Nephila pilipes]
MFEDVSRLRVHVLNHKPNTKRRKALEAIDSVCHSTATPKKVPTIHTSQPPAQTQLFDKFKSVFPEIFNEEDNFVPVTSTPKLQQSPLILQTLPSPPSVRALSPLQEDVISTLNQIVSSVSKYIEKSSSICANNSSQSLSQSFKSSRISSQLPAVSLSLSPSASPELQTDFTNNNPNLSTSNYHCSEIEVTEQISSTETSDYSKKEPCNITIFDEIEHLIQSFSNSPDERHSPDILELILPSSQESMDEALQVLPDNPICGETDFNFLKRVSPPLNGPPKNPAFSKTSYAQAVKNVLARCPFCEKKFYSQMTCNEHIEDIHRSEHIIVSESQNCKNSSSSSSSFKPKLQISKNSSSTAITSNSSKLQDPLKNQTTPASNSKFINPRALFKKPSASSVPAKSFSLLKTQKSSDPKDCPRKIVKIKDPPKKNITPAFMPVLPDYKFFCRHCNDYFPSNLSLTDHLRNSHSITVKTFNSSFRSKTINISPNSPPAPSTVDTQIKGDDVVVPHIEDHEDLLPPLTAALKNFYVPDPNNISSKIPPSPVVRPNIARTISSSTVTDSPASTSEPTIDTTEVDIHQPASSSASPSPPRNCNLCDFVAKNRKGLKLHFFRKHKYKQIPSNVSSNKDPDQIAILPSSQSASSKKSEDPFDSPTVNVGTLGPDVIKKKVTFQVPPNSDSQDFIENVNLPFKMKNKDPPVTNRVQMETVFGTKYWFRTNTSIKKHLNVFHKQKPKKVLYCCSVCDSSISKNPAKHSCLMGNLILPTVINDENVWECHLCENFSASPELEKNNHLAAHRKEEIKNKSPPLIIPPSSKMMKKKRFQKILKNSDGYPGDLPLATPLQEDNSSPGQEPDRVLHQKIDVESISILDSFSEPLDAILEVDDIDDAFPKFEKLLADLSSVIQEHFNLFKTISTQSKKPLASGASFKAFDPKNAQAVQKLYKWNRRRCIRNIVNPNFSRCPAPKENIFNYFKNSWAPPNSKYNLPLTPKLDLPPVIDFLTPETIASCLQGCENSAPGPDLITYHHWKASDPRCFILAKNFNICLKFKSIPSEWKSSNCILIPKKGDTALLENWRPITLSNTIYKLFSKCLARRLQDWCEMHEVLSPCQKGFTPFDGVIEHNFVIGQHLESARRNHSQSFLVWLDISNAFESVPHEIIFSAMANAGIDSEFIDLTRNMYTESSTKIFSNEGSTDPIPISCGVKQGSSWLSGGPTLHHLIELVASPFCVCGLVAASAVGSPAVSGLSLAVRSGVASCCRCCRCVRLWLLPLLSRRFAAAVSGPAFPVPAACLLLGAVRSCCSLFR